MFRNTTIGARLWLLTIVTNLLLLIVGAVGCIGMSRSNDATRQIYQQQLSAATPPLAVAPMTASRGAYLIPPR